MTLTDVVAGAIGCYEEYCDGYGNNNATGLGYLSVMKVATAKCKTTSDPVLDLIVSHDRAAASEAYTGCLNVTTVTSYNGICGGLWGYNVVAADSLERALETPLAVARQFDGSDLPIFDGEPIAEAGRRLFGTVDARRFPLLPGAQVPCAAKSVTASGLTCGNVWAAIAVAVARDRDRSASLFIEDNGTNLPITDAREVLKVRSLLAQRIIDAMAQCGENQHTLFQHAFMAYRVEFIAPDETGAAIATSPYIVLPRRAIPQGQPERLLTMTISEWERAVGLV